MSLTDDRRWSKMNEFHFARVLRARPMLVKQVMSRTCAALSPRSLHGDLLDSSPGAPSSVGPVVILTALAAFKESSVR